MADESSQKEYTPLNAAEIVAIQQETAAKKIAKQEKSHRKGWHPGGTIVTPPFSPPKSGVIHPKGMPKGRVA